MSLQGLGSAQVDRLLGDAEHLIVGHRVLLELRFSQNRSYLNHLATIGEVAVAMGRVELAHRIAVTNLGGVVP